MDGDGGRGDGSDGLGVARALNQLVGRREPVADHQPHQYPRIQLLPGGRSSRDGDDSELALVLLLEDVKIELDPQPRRRVAVVAALDPEAERAVNLGHTDGEVNAAPAVQVALVGSGLHRGEERVLDVDRELRDARGALADIDLAGKL